MTVSENLATLESLHQDVAKAILAMREMVKFNDSFTETVKEQKYAQIMEMVGNAQLKSDEMEDFRSYGTWKPEASD